MNETSEPERSSWLNRNVLGMGATSFLADAGYETATAALPGFLAALGAPTFSLGLIEGVADAVSSFVKLGAGWWGDRIGRRKPIVTVGYVLSGLGGVFFALALAWPMVLLGRVAAWFGKGIRGPLRNALLAESIPAAHRGKAFGFHRAGDTLGAILGPLLGAALLAWLAPTAAGDATAPFRTLFWLTLVPGLGAGLAFALLVQEKERIADPKIRFWSSLQALPAGFRRYLVGVGIFGAGDFAPSLFILAATALLEPVHGLADAAALAALLYALRNGVYAAACYPAGAVSDRYGRRGLLLAGYVLGGGVMLGFAALFAARAAHLPLLAGLFALSGVFIAVEDSLEGALTADLVPEERLRGTAFGVLATVNGVGDFLSSVLVGLLWTWAGYEAGFLYAAGLMLLGAFCLHRVR